MSLQRRQRQRERQMRADECRRAPINPNSLVWRFCMWFSYDNPRWMRVAFFAVMWCAATLAALVFTLGWRLGNRVALWPLGE